MLDEATRHLDLARERIVNDTLRTLATTRLSVAHRLETTRAADRVIRLDRGVIVSDGPPSESAEGVFLVPTGAAAPAPQARAAPSGD